MLTSWRKSIDYLFQSLTEVY